MLGTIRHRGPDEFGIYQDEHATLGSVRLSIVDLSTGQQPICNEDETVWIVFNGEIFNYIELRPDLERRGHRFMTNTDTEVLLHLYEDLGADCLPKLNGEFAFAIWDARQQHLFLARDRFGIRPLFWTEAHGAFYFSSEIKGILSDPAIAAELDPVSLDQVFRYWCPLAGRTIFRGISELPPGHFLKYSHGNVTLQRYWFLSFPPSAERASGQVDHRLADERAEQLAQLLGDATRIRLRSDVPVAAYLSGGLDSSLIARMAADRSRKDLATFSITFDDPVFDESLFQRQVSRLLGTRHEVVCATYRDIAQVFPQVIWHTESPLVRTGPAPMFLLSRLVRDCGFKVALTGEGADEILAGYDIFKEAAIRRFWARHPESRIRPLLFRRLYDDIPGFGTASAAFKAEFFRMGLLNVDSPMYSHMVRWRNNERTRRFFSAELLAMVNGEIGTPPEVPGEFSTWGSLEKSQYLETTIFLSQYLLSSQGDRMAMAHSVESRLPFLDYRVVEFCCHLPSNLKLRGLQEKYLLRRVAQSLLPPEIGQRLKRPYRAPVFRTFFSRPVPDYVLDLLSEHEIKRTGLFNALAVASLVARLLRGEAIGETDSMALAGILSTQLVHHQFIGKFPIPQPLPDERIKFRSLSMAA